MPENLEARLRVDTLAYAVRFGLVEPVEWWNALVRLEAVEAGRVAQHGGCDMDLIKFFGGLIVGVIVISAPVVAFMIELAKN